LIVDEDSFAIEPLSDAPGKTGVLSVSLGLLPSYTLERLSKNNIYLLIQGISR